MRIAETELDERPDLALAAVVVGLVGDEQHGTVGALQDPTDLGVFLGDADGDVDHHEHDIGFLDRALGLVAHLLRQRFVGGDPAAGVDHPEGAAVPLRDEFLAVAGDPGLLLHDRFAAADEAVDERGLAHVGPSDHRDDGQRTDVRLTSPSLRRRPGHAMPDGRRAQRTRDAPSVPTTSTGRGQIGQREAVEESVLGQHDVGQQHPRVGRDRGERGADVGTGQQPGDRDVAAEEAC